MDSLRAVGKLPWLGDEHPELPELLHRREVAYLTQKVVIVLTLYKRQRMM
jgi:hypothetical protein